jgi:hypothetical protein
MSCFAIKSERLHSGVSRDLRATCDHALTRRRQSFVGKSNLWLQRNGRPYAVGVTGKQPILVYRLVGDYNRGVG